MSPPSLYLTSTLLQPLLYIPHKFLTAIVSLNGLASNLLSNRWIKLVLTKSLSIKLEYIFTDMFYALRGVWMDSLCNDWTFLASGHWPPSYTEISWNSFLSPLWILLCGKLSKPAEIEGSFTKNICLLTKQLPNSPSDNSSSWMEVPIAISLVCSL